MEEVDDGPRGARGAAEDGEDEEPGEEDDEDVGRPDARVHEPLGVLVQIRGRERLHVQLRHPGAPEQSLIAGPPASTNPSAPGDGRTAGHGGGTDGSSNELCGCVLAVRCGGCGGGIYRCGIGGDEEGGREGGWSRGVQRWGRKINEAVRGTGEMEEGRGRRTGAGAWRGDCPRKKTRRRHGRLGQRWREATDYGLSWAGLGFGLF